MLNALAVAVGLLLLVLTSATAPFVNVGSVGVAIPVVMTAYASARRDTFGGVLVALAMGWVAGVMTGGFRGPLLFALLAVVGATRWGVRRFPLQSVWGLAGWSMLAVVISDVVFVAVAALAGSDGQLAGVLLRSTPAASLASGLLALPIAWGLGALEPHLRERQERSTLLT